MNFLTKLSAVLAAATLSTSNVLQSPPQDGSFELLILHNNDMHARFEQTSQLSGACTLADREAGKCYGGFPRVAHVVKEARKAAASGQGPPVLYLNAGDTYTGTAWFTIYKWKIAAEFVNALHPDAVSLGNNEVDSGSSTLSPFIDSLSSTIIATNVIVNPASNNDKIKTSLIKEINGQKVGIVGYLTPETKILDSAGNIEYIDEIIALNDEIKKLEAQKVSIIIALGHADYRKDIEIATKVEGLDIVIAGHRNKYFWNGTSAEQQHIDVGMTVVQESGREVVIAESYAYSKYLGGMKVWFDSEGEVVSYKMDTILLDDNVPEDLEALQIAKKYNEEITLLSDEVVGQTAVVLDGESCKIEECNLGNLITHAMMYYHAVNFEGERWTDAPIAVIPSGHIAASIAPTNRPADVTRNHLMTAIPRENNIVAVTMNGDILVQMLEHSVSDYTRNDPSGQLLQTSGIRVVYDLEKEPGSRIVSAVVRCWACFVPEFFVIDSWRDYKILMPASLANGEYGYSMLVGLPKEELDYDVLTVTAEYIQLRSPVYPEVAGGLTLLNVVDPAPDSATSLTSSLVLIIALMSLLL